MDEWVSTFMGKLIHAIKIIDPYQQNPKGQSKTVGGRGWHLLRPYFWSSEVRGKAYQWHKMDMKYYSSEANALGYCCCAWFENIKLGFYIPITLFQGSRASHRKGEVRKCQVKTLKTHTYLIWWQRVPPPAMARTAPWHLGYGKGHVQVGKCLLPLVTVTLAADHESNLLHTYWAFSKTALTVTFSVILLLSLLTSHTLCSKDETHTLANSTDSSLCDVPNTCSSNQWLPLFPAIFKN